MRKRLEQTLAPSFTALAPTSIPADDRHADLGGMAEGFDDKAQEEDMKALVVYYSRSGNTKAVAELIAAAIPADLEPLVEIGVNRKGLLGYLGAGRGGVFKKKSTLQTPSKDPVNYDLVFIGTPVWGWNLAPAVRSYMGQTNFGSAPVALFCTMGGSGQDKAFASMRAEAPNANVIGEMAVEAAAITNPVALQQKIEDWVKGLAPEPESAT